MRRSGRATLDFSIGLVPPFAGGGWSNVNGTINFSSFGSVLQVTGTGQTITDPAEFTYIWGALPWPGSVCGPAGGGPDRIKTKIDRF